MDATYYLDNTGYFDTEFEWSFADTMLTTTFVSFKTKLTYWRDEVSPRIFTLTKEWNKQWQSQPVAHNLMSMVVSEKDVSHSSSNLLLVRILADPRALMNSNYKVIVYFLLLKMFNFSEPSYHKHLAGFNYFLKSIL